MNDKSHVSLEQHVCLICGTAFDTGAILLDKRLRASMGRHTATGWGLCPAHQKLFDDGFVALVECDPQRSGSPQAGHMKPEQAHRTDRKSTRLNSSPSSATRMPSSALKQKKTNI